jgi:hypothetical protein
MPRTQAKDYSNVNKQHKPGTKGNPAAAMVKPPLTRGPVTSVSPTQPDTRVK